MRERVLVVIEILAVIVLIALLYRPVRSTGVRLAIVACLLFTVAASVHLTWKKFHLGKVVLMTTLGVLVWVLATLGLGPPPKDTYVSALVRYVGTRYVWGGETGRGIDCSGLIRMGLRDSYLEEGRWGAALEIWLVDSAARDLGTSYGTIWSPVGEAPSIAGMDPSRIPAGSIVVTRDGVHTLAYLGGGNWIQASPGDGRVTIKSVADADPWFEVPVRLFQLRGED